MWFRPQSCVQPKAVYSDISNIMKGSLCPTGMYHSLFSSLVDCSQREPAETWKSLRFTDLAIPGNKDSLMAPFRSLP